MKKLLTILMILLTATLVHAQQQPPMLTVTGIVVSGENNQPLSGATVLIKGAKKGIVTDALGKFTAKVEKNQILVISFAGFEPQEIKVTAPTNLSISLQVRVVEGDEVVVVGYGTRKKSHLTGSIAKVTNDNLSQIPVSRADEALRGKLAGVSVVTTDAQPGASPTIQVRGATSITAGSDPLIVIDGYPVPTDLSAIDMADVESIEVLKDAASAAIYGSRGGNGVIIITTKSGKVGKGKVTLNIISGVKSVYRKLPYPTLNEWDAFVRSQNGGILPATTLTGAAGPAVYFADAHKFDGDVHIQDDIFRDVNYNSVNLGFSGANTNFKYYFSGTALFDNGVMLGNDYRRYNARAGFEAKVNPKVTITFSVNPSVTVFYRAPISLQEAFRQSPPWLPKYHNDTSSFYTGKPVGSYANSRDFDPGRNAAYLGTVNLSSATTNNFYTQLTGTTDKRTQIRNITNFSVKYDFNKNLSFKTSGGFFTGTNEREYFRKSFVAADPYLDGEAYARSTSLGIYENAKTIDLLTENLLTYRKVSRKHDIDAIAGFTAQYSQINTMQGQATNFATDKITTLNAGMMKSLSTNVEQHALTSFLGRVNYAYDNKYLLSVSARADGSSRFGPDNRWGFFPAASIGWRLSRERFFPESKVFTDVKLRASYGATGNENIPNYRYSANVISSNAVLGTEPSGGFQLSSYGNPDLGWESTYSTNIGGDFSFFNGKLNLTVDYYNTRTDKLLLNQPIAAASGFLTYTVNKGSVANDGIEFELSGPVITSKNFKWTVSGNIYFNKNKLVDFGGTESLITQGDPGRPNFYLAQLGSPLTQFYGYVIDSVVTIRGTTAWPINLTAARAFVRDMNKDGAITDDDRVVLGNPYPDYNWGFTSNIKYKDFDFSFTFQGSHGAKLFNVDPYYYENQLGTSGSTAHTVQGYVTAAQLAPIKEKWTTNYNIQDGSYIALRNVNIGYNFPNKLMKKWKLGGIRVYLTGANVFYKFADSYTSFNPEGDNGFTTDPLRKGYQRGGAPITRNISAGLNLTF
jgi:TonB-linked SusC/RagA family outer membrane protein